VKLLEESLGVQLFDRSGRTTRLTDAGGVYLQYANRASQELREATRALHNVSDLSRGSLRVAVTPTFTTYLVGPLIEAFHSRYPKITFNVREISQEVIEDLLLEGELDVGIAFLDVLNPDIEAVPLLDETLALFCLARSLRLAGRLIVTAVNTESILWC
jgi:LysR family cyn operon transcriptional activator